MPADLTTTPGGTPTATATPAQDGESTPPVDLPAPVLEDAARLHRDGRFEEAALAYAAIGTAQDDATVRATAFLGAAVAWYQDADLARSSVALRESVAAAPEGTQAWRRARYLLGTRLVDSGEHQEATQVLEPLIERRYDDALQPRIDALYAEAAAQSGSRDAAVAAWNLALTSPHLLRSLEVDIYRARIIDARAQGDGNATALWIGELARVAADPEDRYTLARLALDTGDRATFEAQLVAIVQQDAGSLYAPMAIADLEEAGFTADPGDAGYVAYRHRRYRQARELLATSLADGSLTASQRAWRTYYLAASYEDAGYPADAIPLYDEAAALDPGSDIAHRAQYWAARSAEALGDTTSASARYLALALATPQRTFTAEAAFRAGYVRLIAGDAAGAVDAWQTDGAMRDGRMLYWLGRANRDLGDVAAAEAAFSEAVTRDPLSFFGIEAARELGQPPDDTPDYQPAVTGAPPDWDAIATWLGGGLPTTAGPAAETAAGDLVALGLEDEAAATLAEAPVGHLSRLRAAQELGLTAYAARLATTLVQDSGQALQQVPKDLLRIAYPLGYVALLDEYGAAESVDPLFIAALIRTESFWDADAVSFAGAIGLTQVISPTGQAIAAALGFSDWTPDQLTRPAISVRFGAYYIGAQLRRFGNPYQALAAYNGGPGNALVWGASASPANPADFTEAITFAETRSYVEHVMTSYAVYRFAHRS